MFNEQQALISDLKKHFHDMGNNNLFLETIADFLYTNKAMSCNGFTTHLTTAADNLLSAAGCVDLSDDDWMEDDCEWESSEYFRVDDVFWDDIDDFN